MISLSDKLQINLFDSCFGNDNSATAGQTPRNIEYVRVPYHSLNNISIYTNIDMFTQNVSNPDTSYGYLYEAFDVMPDAYILLPQVLHKFKKIFTFYEPFCAWMPEKFMWVPAMGTWIGGNRSNCSIGITEKSKLCSMVCSPKSFTRGHQYRQEVANVILRNYPWINMYGLHSKFQYAEEPLIDHMFSVVIENGVQPGYFTEKLLNCFALGTIPIYYGCPTIGRYFNTKGIIQLNDFLTKKITLTKDLYDSMIEYARDNLRILLEQHWDIPEDYISGYLE